VRRFLYYGVAQARVAKVTTIAMWSGPRNISTAMMRAWGSRTDTYVTDEPFYAHYLARVPVDHPGRAEILASQEQDWRKIADRLAGPVPQGRAIWFQKHMTKHLLPGMIGAWMTALRHALLIREPAGVVASFARVVGRFDLAETGYLQQRRLFEYLRANANREPVVVDSADILRDPRGMLGKLCEALAVPFDAAMLSWAPGPRATDGVWGKYWYGRVLRSRGFEPYREQPVELPDRLAPLYEQALPHYEFLYARRLRLD
jgi:Sulfotransferase domain